MNKFSLKDQAVRHRNMTVFWMEPIFQSLLPNFYENYTRSHSNTRFNDFDVSLLFSNAATIIVRPMHLQRMNRFKMHAYVKYISLFQSVFSVFLSFFFYLSLCTALILFILHIFFQQSYVTHHSFINVLTDVRNGSQ